ncbi:MAG: DUF262 domain-containing protein [Promethearchaeota archaeon]
MDKGVYSYGKLITSRISLEIPEYQRHYSWDNKQWEDLWNDLFYLEFGKTHYFGTVILMEKEIPEEMPGIWFDKLEIVDGQQRIATSLILIREILSSLDKSSVFSKDRIRKLKEDYLRYESIYKLELLGDDREFFRRYIIEEENPFEIQTPSQDKLKRAQLFFKNKLRKIKDKYDTNEFMEFLLQLLKKIDMMELMVYPIKETTEAAKMFELVNDRGKDLTNLDKTKSYLMYMIYLTADKKDQERYLRNLNNCFGNIFRCIMDIQNSKYGKDINEDDIQRYHYIIYSNDEMISLPSSPIKYTRSDASTQYMELLKPYIMSIYMDDKKRCLNFIDNYSKDLENSFFTLKNIFIYDEDNDIRKTLNRIFLLNRPANFYPLLISFWNRINDSSHVKEILKYIEIMIFRVYAIGKRRSDAGRSTLYDLAYEVHVGSKNYNEIIDDLQSSINYYESEKRYKEHLKSNDFYYRTRGNDIRYMLYLYESYLRRIQGEPLEFTLNEILSRDKFRRPNYEIEHIWSQDISELNLTDEELLIHEEYVHNLGNLTLASKNWNRSMGNKPFIKKRKKYQTSSIKIQRILARHNKWGKEQIKKRLDEIINFALEQWRI